MANVYVNLPPSAGDGVGAGQSVASLGQEKTVTVEGTFTGTVIIEFSLDAGVTWAQVLTFTNPGKAIFPGAAQQARVRRSGVNPSNPGTPNVDIAAEDNAGTFTALPAPAADGVGAAVDVSALGNLMTVTAIGTYTGIVIVELSEDNTSWVPCFSFPSPGLISKSVTARFLRVRRSGTTPGNPGSVTVALGTIEAGGGGGGSGDTVMTLLDDGSTLNVFVDGTNGNDGNDGLTSTTALQTIQEVYRKFPWQMFNNSRILVNLLNPSTTTQLTYAIEALHIGSGNISFFNSYAFRGPQMIAFVPATGPSTAALDAVPCTRVDQTQAPSATGNRTAFNFTTAAPGWTDNDLAGSFIRVTRGGALVIFELPITENTSDHIYVDSLDIVGVVLSTDTAEVVTPAVRITHPDGASTALSIFGNGASIQGIPNTTYCTFERIGFGHVMAAGLGVITFDRCQFEDTGSSGRLTTFSHWQVGFTNTVAQCGIHLIYTGSSSTVRRSDGVLNPISTISITDLQIAPRDGVSIRGLAIGSPTTAAGSPRSSGTYAPSASLSVYRASSHGIAVIGPGSWFVSSVPLNGRDNSGVGLRVSFGGLARITAGTTATITGSGGDLRVGTGAAVPYGTGVGGFEEVAGWNGNLLRLITTATTAVGDPSRITTQSLTV